MVIEKRGYVIPNYYYAGIFLVLVLVGVPPLNETLDITGSAVKMTSHDRICSNFVKQLTAVEVKQTALIKLYDLQNPEGTAAKYVGRLNGGDCSAANLEAQRTAAQTALQAATTRTQKQQAQQAMNQFKKLEKACKTVLNNCRKLEFTYDENSARLRALDQQYERLTTQLQDNNCGVPKAGRRDRTPDLLFCIQPEQPPEPVQPICAFSDGDYTCYEYVIATDGTGTFSLYNAGQTEVENTQLHLEGKTTTCTVRSGSGNLPTWPPGRYATCIIPDLQIDNLEPGSGIYTRADFTLTFTETVSRAPRSITGQLRTILGVTGAS